MATNYSSYQTQIQHVYYYPPPQTPQLTPSQPEKMYPVRRVVSAGSVRTMSSTRPVEQRTPDPRNLPARYRRNSRSKSALFVSTSEHHTTPSVGSIQSNSSLSSGSSKQRRTYNSSISSTETSTDSDSLTTQISQSSESTVSDDERFRKLAPLAERRPSDLETRLNRRRDKLDMDVANLSLNETKLVEEEASQFREAPTEPKTKPIEVQIRPVKKESKPVQPSKPNQPIQSTQPTQPQTNEVKEVKEVKDKEKEVKEKEVKEKVKEVKEVKEKARGTKRTKHANDMVLPSQCRRRSYAYPEPPKPAPRSVSTNLSRDLSETFDLDLQPEHTLPEPAPFFGPPKVSAPTNPPVNNPEPKPIAVSHSGKPATASPAPPTARDGYIRRSYASDMRTEQKGGFNKLLRVFKKDKVADDTASVKSGFSTNSTMSMRSSKSMRSLRSAIPRFLRKKSEPELQRSFSVVSTSNASNPNPAQSPNSATPTLATPTLATPTLASPNPAIRHPPTPPLDTFDFSVPTEAEVVVDEPIDGQNALLSAGDIFPGKLRAENVDVIVSSIERTGSFERVPSSASRTSLKRQRSVISQCTVESHEPNVEMQRPRSCMQQPSKGRRRSGALKSGAVQFAPQIIVYKTYSALDYDRTPGRVTCDTLKEPGVVQRIREELNVVKLTMPVHPKSQGFTQFFY